MKVLNADEALKEVYRLTPQMAEYDKFISELRWLPYTMFFHPKDYRSDAVNTDQLGFRRTRHNGRNISVAELPEHGRINLLVGGSNVVGTGATADEHTTSSYLSEYTGETWLNFGSRGYNAMQEALLFLMHQNKLDRIGHVVVLSGMNTLTLEGLPDSMATDHGRYYYSYEYEHYMNKYCADLRARSGGSDTGKRNPLERLRNFLADGEEDANPTATVITDEESQTSDRVARASHEITNALALWKQLLAPYDAKLSFVLQPLTHWTKDTLTPQEAEIFNAIDSCPNNFWRLFGKILAREVHAPFADSVRAGCAAQGIPFYDMNALLRDSPILNESLFVDRVHCTDAGYAEVARLIQKAVLHSTTPSTHRSN